MLDFLINKEVFIVRRGSAILGKVSSKNLTRLIEGRKLFGTDRVSRDGKTWNRLDQIGKFRRQLAAVEQAAPQQAGILS